jgi:hypothetical protein
MSEHLQNLIGEQVRIELNAPKSYLQGTLEDCDTQWIQLRPTNPPGAVQFIPITSIAYIEAPTRPKERSFARS